jgi:hypothetical protein
MPAAPVPQPQAPGFQPFGKEKYAPTVWENDDEMDDDMMDLPKEKRIGPESFMSGMDDEGPPAPGAPPKEKAPLPFAQPPLPKGGLDRSRELKDRRRREVEELTEEITDEKWSEIVSRIQGLEEKVESMSVSVKSAETQLPGPGAPPGELEAIRKEIEAHKHSVEETNARIDSLEEVVKGSLTPMVESIRKFSHAVKGAKEPVLAPEPVAEEPAPAPVQTEPEEAKPKPAEKK